MLFSFAYLLYDKAQCCPFFEIFQNSPTEALLAQFFSLNVAFLFIDLSTVCPWMHGETKKGLYDQDYITAFPHFAETMKTTTEKTGTNDEGSSDGKDIGMCQI